MLLSSDSLYDHSWLVSIATSMGRIRDKAGNVQYTEP